MTKEFKCPHPRSYVASQEKLTRFVYEQSHIKNNRVKQQVFYPGRDNALSVYRTNEISAQQIWHLCDAYVDGLRGDGKKAYGRAELSAKIFTDLGFTFNPDGKPHTRHTNVLGWNTHKPDDLEKRNLLALAATGYTKPR